MGGQECSEANTEVPPVSNASPSSVPLNPPSVQVSEMALTTNKEGSSITPVTSGNSEVIKPNKSSQKTIERKNVFKRSLFSLSKAVKLYQTKNFENQELLKSIENIKNRSNSVFAQYLLAQEQLHTLKKQTSEILEKYNKLQQDSMKYIKGEVMDDFNKATTKVQYLESTITQLEAEVTEYRTKNCRSAELEQEVTKFKQSNTALQTKLKSLEDQLARKVEQMKALDAQNRTAKKTATLLTKSQEKNDQLENDLTIIRNKHSQLYGIINGLDSPDDDSTVPETDRDFIQKITNKLASFLEKHQALDNNVDTDALMKEKLDELNKLNEGATAKIEEKHFQELQALEDSFKRKLEIETKSLKDMLLSIKEEYSVRVQTDNSLINSLKAHISQLEEKLSVFEKANNTLEHEDSTELARLQKLTQELSSKLTNLQETESRASFFEKSNAELAKELAALQEVNENVLILKKQNTHLTSQVASLRAYELKLLVFEKENVDLRNELEALKKAHNQDKQTSTLSDSPTLTADLFEDPDDVFSVASPSKDAPHEINNSAFDSKCMKCDEFTIGSTYEDLKLNITKFKSENEILNNQLQKCQLELTNYSKLQIENQELKKMTSSLKEVKTQITDFSREKQVIYDKLLIADHEKESLLKENTKLSGRIKELEAAQECLSSTSQLNQESSHRLLIQQSEDSRKIDMLRKKIDQLSKKAQITRDLEITNSHVQNSHDKPASLSVLEETFNSLFESIQTDAANLSNRQVLLRTIDKFQEKCQQFREVSHPLRELQSKQNSHFTGELINSNRPSDEKYSKLVRDNKLLLSKYKKLKESQEVTENERKAAIDKLLTEKVSLIQSNDHLLKTKRALQDTLTDQLVEIQTLKSMLKKTSANHPVPSHVTPTPRQAKSASTPNTSEFEYSSPVSSPNSHKQNRDLQSNSLDSQPSKRPRTTQYPSENASVVYSSTNIDKSNVLDTRNIDKNDTQDIRSGRLPENSYPQPPDLYFDSLGYEEHESLPEANFDLPEVNPSTIESIAEVEPNHSVSKPLKKKTQVKKIFPRNSNWTLSKNIRQVIISIPEKGNIKSWRIDPYQDFSSGKTKELVNGLVDYITSPKEFMDTLGQVPSDYEYTIDQKHRVLFPDFFVTWECRLALFIIVFITRFPKSPLLNMLLTEISHRVLLFSSSNMTTEFPKHLIHLFGFLCKMTKDQERTRVLAYDLLASGLGRADLLDNFVALANVYPNPFSFSFTSIHPNHFLSTCQSVISSIIPAHKEANGVKPVKELYSVLVRKCSWSPYSKSMSLKNMYDTLLESYSELADASGEKASYLRLIHLLSLFGDFIS